MEVSSLIQNLTFCGKIRYRLEAHGVSRVVGALVFGAAGSILGQAITMMHRPMLHSKKVQSGAKVKIGR